MSRRALIIVVSLVVHLGLGVTVLVSGAWRLERLDRPRAAALALGVMLPPAPAGGGGEAAAAAAPKPKLAPKRRVKEPVQPTPPREDRAELAAATDATTGEHAGTGSGRGDGDGKGDGDGDGGDGDGSCAGDACGVAAASPPVCGDRRVEAPETCDDGNTTSGDGCSSTCRLEPAVIPPTVLAGLRVSGDTQIVPPDPVKTMMLRDGRDRTTASLKVCIGATGAVTSVAVIGSTKYPAYDARLLAAVRAWRYRPYTINGAPAPSCSAVTFVYTIR